MAETSFSNMIFHSKRTLGFALLFMAHAYSLQAQKDDIYRITSDQEVNQVIPMKVKYRYEAFQPGTVSFYNGKTSNGQLNYNILLGDMQFIDRTRDTLSLTNQQTIQQIRIGDDTFFYDKKYGYLEVVQEYPLVKLAVHQQITPINREKTAGFGQSTGTSAVREYRSVSTSGGRIHELELKGDLLLSKKVTYLLIDRNRRVRRANRTGILRAFSREKKAINAYLEEHKINFSQLKDLQALLDFCSEVAS